jgi:hypothetical protein
MLVELIQIHNDASGNYRLETIYINPDQVVFLTENNLMRQKLMEGEIKLGLNQNFTKFTNVRVNSYSYAINIVVVGDPGAIEEKINLSKRKTLLKG